MNKILLVTAVVTLFACGASATDARDGLRACWMSLGDLNENGIVDAGEVYDAVNYSTTATPSTATAVTHTTTESDAGAAAPIVHSNANYRTPLGYVQLTGRKVLEFNTKTNYNAKGEMTTTTQGIKLPCDNLNLSGSFSVVARVLLYQRICRKYGATGDQGHMHIFAYDWNSTAGTGFSVILRPDSGGNWNYMRVNIGNTNAESSFGSINWNTGYWFDLCYTVSANDPEPGKSTVNFYYRCSDGEKLGGGNAMTVSTAKVLDYVPSFSEGARTAYLANPAPYAGYSHTANGFNQFRGLMDFVKVYDRAITPEEFDGACVPYEDPLWSVGVRNGAADEFSDSAAVEVFEPDSMPWYKLRKSLTAAHPSLSVKCDLAAADLEIPRVLQVKTVGADGFKSGTVRVAVNGADIGSMDVTAGQDSVFFIKQRIMRTITQVDESYPMTLTLTRTGDMTGTLTFDWLAVQGGWQLGLDDNAYGEFQTWKDKSTRNFYTHYIGQRDLKSMSVQLNAGDATMQNECLRFFLTDEMAAKCGFEYQTKACTLGVYNFYVNGVLQDPARRLENKEYYTIPFDIGALKPGMNEIRWERLSDVSGNGGPDFHRLVPIKGWRDSGMVLIFR